MLGLCDVWRGLTGATAEMPADLAAVALTGVVVDSRAVQPGMLFVALRGEKTDGHLYLQDAFERGALAAIAEPRALELDLAAHIILPDGTLRRAPEQASRLAQGEDGRSAGPMSAPTVFVVPDSLAGLQRLAGHWRAQWPASAVAITGSVGKTTSKEVIANVLSQRYVTLRSEGNLNNEIGLPLTLLSLTPKHERIVLEMGMYALKEIARLCELARPRIGVVTNIGPTHLERLRSLDRIVKAKAELVQALPAAEEGGVAILNADDPLVLGMAGLTRARIFTYGLHSDSNLGADEIAIEVLEGILFRLHYGRETLHVHLPMLGRHSVHTALRGAAVGLVEGLSWHEILGGLRDVCGQLRLMVVPGPHGTTVVDDTYNASPASMLAALNLIADIAAANQRRVAVLGDMLELGEYEEEGHRVVGGRAAQVVAKLVTVGQRAGWIAEEALATGMQPIDVYRTASTSDAIAVLQGLIRPGDIVLVKGSRALAMETIVDGLSRPRSAES